jgi:hypothetical protein
VRRWLASDALKPWQHRSWIFPRDPYFALKAARALDLYAQVWEGEPLGKNDFVLSADEKPGVQARAPVLVPLGDAPGDVGVDLGLQGLGQHPTGTLTDDLIAQRRTAVPAGVISVGSSRNYSEHASYLPDRR